MSDKRTNLVNHARKSAWSSEAQSFPKSIFDNVACSPSLQGEKQGELQNVVESSLRAAALWRSERRSQKSALALSAASNNGSASPVPWPGNPGVLLMDEPAPP
jgi:ABC-type phosphate transport system ATPase subunit